MAIFLQKYIANGSDAFKIQVSFHLLTFTHLGWCLRCEGEGLSHFENVVSLVVIGDQKINILSFEPGQLGENKEMVCKPL